MINVLRRMLAEKVNPDRYEWVLGCDIVKDLQVTSDLYLLGDDIEQIKLFGLPVKVDFKEPNKIELRERVPEPVGLKTTRKDKYLLGCLHAISKLLDEGSVNFVIEVDGKWETIPWTEICDWIDTQMEGGMKND